MRWFLYRLWCITCGTVAATFVFLTIVNLSIEPAPIDVNRPLPEYITEQWEDR